MDGKQKPKAQTERYQIGDNVWHAVHGPVRIEKIWIPNKEYVCTLYLERNRRMFLRAELFEWKLDYSEEEMYEIIKKSGAAIQADIQGTETGKPKRRRLRGFVSRKEKKE